MVHVYVMARYQFSALESICELLSEDVFALIRVEADAKQRLVLGSDPSIPLTLKGLVIDQRRVTAVFILFVVFLDRVQITICVDIRRKDENTRGSRVAEVCGGGDRERADRSGLPSADGALVECDWNSEYLLFLVFVFTCFYDMRDGTEVKPEGIATVGKWEIMGLGYAIDGCYSEGLVCSVCGLMKPQTRREQDLCTYLRSSKEYLLTEINARSPAGLGIGAPGLGRESISWGESTSGDDLSANSLVISARVGRALSRGLGCGEGTKGCWVERPRRPRATLGNHMADIDGDHLGLPSFAWTLAFKSVVPCT
jgi:hypothetical protein